MKTLPVTTSVRLPWQAITIVVLVLAILGSFSCRSSFSPSVNGTPVIHYRISGGFGGENSPVITIYSDRIAIRHGYPDLGIRLSEGSFSRLIKMFDGFDSLAGPYLGGWADDITHYVEFSKRGSVKTVSFEGGSREGKAYIGLHQLFRIVDTLRQLSDSICRTELPWRDVTVSFSTDKLVYGPGQPVHLIYTISNPTNDKRTLLFRQGPQYSFHVGRDNMNYTYPNPQAHYDNGPSEIELEAYEQKELIHSIDLQEAFGVQPPPGTYSAFMRLESGTCFANLETPDRLYFELADSSMPIGGKAEVDTMRRGDDTQRHVFTLLVQNWTMMPLVLTFPRTQQTAISLHVGNTLLYGDSGVLHDRITEVTLQPDEIRRFTHTSDKDIRQILREERINTDSPKVRISLLADNYSITREVTVRLSKQSRFPMRGRR